MQWSSDPSVKKTVQRNQDCIQIDSSDAEPVDDDKIRNKIMEANQLIQRVKKALGKIKTIQTCAASGRGEICENKSSSTDIEITIKKLKKEAEHLITTDPDERNKKSCIKKSKITNLPVTSKEHVKNDLHKNQEENSNVVVPLDRTFIKEATSTGSTKYFPNTTTKKKVPQMTSKEHIKNDLHKSQEENSNVGVPLDRTCIKEATSTGSTKYFPDTTMKKKVPQMTSKEHIKNDLHKNQEENSNVGVPLDRTCIKEATSTGSTKYFPDTTTNKKVPQMTSKEHIKNDLHKNQEENSNVGVPLDRTFIKEATSIGSTKYYLDTMTEKKVPEKVENLMEDPGNNPNSINQSLNYCIGIERPKTRRNETDDDQVEPLCTDKFRTSRENAHLEESSSFEELQAKLHTISESTESHISTPRVTPEDTYTEHKDKSCNTDLAKTESKEIQAVPSTKTKKTCCSNISVSKSVQAFVGPTLTESIQVIASLPSKPKNLEEENILTQEISPPSRRQSSNYKEETLPVVAVLPSKEKLCPKCGDLLREEPMIESSVKENLPDLEVLPCKQLLCQECCKVLTEEHLGGISLPLKLQKLKNLTVQVLPPIIIQRGMTITQVLNLSINADGESNNRVRNTTNILFIEVRPADDTQYELTKRRDRVKSVDKKVKVEATVHQDQWKRILENQPDQVKARFDNLLDKVIDKEVEATAHEDQWAMMSKNEPDEVKPMSNNNLEKMVNGVDVVAILDNKIDKVMDQYAVDACIDIESNDRLDEDYIKAMLYKKFDEDTDDDEVLAISDGELDEVIDKLTKNEPNEMVDEDEVGAIPDNENVENEIWNKKPEMEKTDLQTKTSRTKLVTLLPPYSTIRRAQISEKTESTTPEESEPTISDDIDKNARQDLQTMTKLTPKEREDLNEKMIVFKSYHIYDNPNTHNPEQLDNESVPYSCDYEFYKSFINPSSKLPENNFVPQASKIMTGYESKEVQCGESLAKVGPEVALPESAKMKMQHLDLDSQVTVLNVNAPKATLRKNDTNDQLPRNDSRSECLSPSEITVTVSYSTSTEEGSRNSNDFKKIGSRSQETELKTTNFEEIAEAQELSTTNYVKNPEEPEVMLLTAADKEVLDKLREKFKHVDTNASLPTYSMMKTSNNVETLDNFLKGLATIHTYDKHSAKETDEAHEGKQKTDESVHTVNYLLKQNIKAMDKAYPRHLELGKNGRYRDEENMFTQIPYATISDGYQRTNGQQRLDRYIRRPPEKEVTKDKFESLPRRSLKNYSPDTSNSDTVTNNSISEGEVRCRHSISNGEIHVCRHSPQCPKLRHNVLTARRNPKYAPTPRSPHRIPQLARKFDIRNDPTVTIEQKRNYFNNWVTYFVKAQDIYESSTSTCSNNKP